MRTANLLLLLAFCAGVQLAAAFSFVRVEFYEEDGCEGEPAFKQEWPIKNGDGGKCVTSDLPAIPNTDRITASEVTCSIDGQSLVLFDKAPKLELSLFTRQPYCVTGNTDNEVPRKRSLSVPGKRCYEKFYEVTAGVDYTLFSNYSTRVYHDCTNMGTVQAINSGIMFICAFLSFVLLN